MGILHDYAISSQEKIKNGNKKKEGGWSEIHYRLLGCIMIFVGIVLAFYWGYWVSLKQVSNQRRFGIVNINNETYAVIDANENKLILQKCEIDQTVLKINKNTYLCTGNEIPINFQIFDNVKVE